MNERMICLDILLDGEDKSKAEKIRQRVAQRKPKSGSIFLRDENRWSSLRGGEIGALTRMAEKRVNGVIYGVDGVFFGGINIAAKVTEEESVRISQNPSCFISTNVKIPPVF